MSPEEKLEMGRKLIARTLEEPTLMPLTLEEIEKRLATADRNKTDGISWRSVDLLLAIAQEQRGAMAADEERTRAAAMRVWGEHVRGCDTADAMADLIVRQREEIARLRGDLAQADAALRSVP